MISITQVGSLYNISFKYDPELVDMIKKVPGKSWNPIEKYWTIEKSKLGFSGRGQDQSRRIDRRRRLGRPWRSPAALNAKTGFPETGQSGRREQCRFG